MQIAVVYYSRTGNTKELAEAVAGGVESVDGAKALLRDTGTMTKDDFLESSGIIAGSPVYFGLMAADMKRMFDEFIGVRKKMEGKVGAAFATSGDPTGGKETTLFSIIQAMLIYGMLISGDPLSATGHYGTACVGAPDETARENGAKLGARVAEVARKLTL